jgi:hypothetical protein
MSLQDSRLAEAETTTGTGGSSEPPFEKAGTGAQIARMLLGQGLLTDSQLRHALRIRENVGEEHSLAKIVNELGYLTDQQLRAQGDTVPLGSLLVELGHLRPAALRAPLEPQRDPAFAGKRLGEILVEKHLIHERELVDVLADQLGFPSIGPSFTELDRELAPGISSRIKVLARANIAEKRRHQGGGFRFEDPATGRRSDIRVSFYATIFGEKIVLRLLSREAELLVLNEMVKEAILAKKTSSEIRRTSMETSGLITLLEDGVAKAAQGYTTIHEILRHLPRFGRPHPPPELLRDDRDPRGHAPRDGLPPNVQLGTAGAVRPRRARPSLRRPERGGRARRHNPASRHRVSKAGHRTAR